MVSLVLHIECWFVGPVCSKVLNINTLMNLFKNIHFIYIVL